MKHGFQSVVIDKNDTATSQVAVSEDPKQRTRVRGLVLSSDATVTAELLSGSTRLVRFNLIAGVPVVLPLTEGGIGEHWFQCAAGEPLNIVLGGAEQVDGAIFYDHIGGPQ